MHCVTLSDVLYWSRVLEPLQVNDSPGCMTHAVIKKDSQMRRNLFDWPCAVSQVLVSPPENGVAGKLRVRDWLETFCCVIRKRLGINCGRDILRACIENNQDFLSCRKCLADIRLPFAGHLLTTLPVLATMRCLGQPDSRTHGSLHYPAHTHDPCNPDCLFSRTCRKARWPCRLAWWWSQVHRKVQSSVHAFQLATFAYFQTTQFEVAKICRLARTKSLLLLIPSLSRQAELPCKLEHVLADVRKAFSASSFAVV